MASTGNNINRFLIILLFSISSAVFSQNIRDTIVSKEIKDIYHSFMADAEEKHQNGKKILKLAKTSKEYICAYELMSDGLYKKHHYSQALFYYKKRDSLAKKLNEVSGRFYSNYFMTAIYQRVGLTNLAKETYGQMLKFSPALDPKDSYYMILQSESAFLEDNYNFCESISKREKQLHLTKELLTENPTIPYSKHLVFGSYNRLAYNYLKCNEISKAEDNIKKAESIVEGIPLEEIDLVYEYYLNKALLALENHSVSEGRYWFDKALTNAENSKIQIGVMKVLEQRINYNIDDWKTKKTYVKKYDELKQNKKIEAAKIIESEEKLKVKAIKNKENYIIVLIVISLILCLGIIALVKYYKNKKKKQRIKFNQIIDELQKQKTFLEKDLVGFSKNDKVTKLKDDNLPEKKNIKESVSSGKAISEEKEKELLQKLIEFERGEQYLKKNFTRSNMATLLGTNSWYISILLQEHRGKQFSDYINHIRIEYIVNLIYNNPEYLKYKISHLSDLCGFTSHSRFAQIFKKEKGISPSEFISGLSENQAS